MKYVFYHITDSHYYSKKNFSCDPWSLPQFDSQISFRESEEILKEALNIILNDNETDTVIFTGDMTDHGDEYSHRELLCVLSDFENKGGKPFVVTDSHDYPWFEIFRIDENGNKAPKEHMKREDVVPMYYPFGRDKGFDKFEGDDTTYIAEIFPGLRYIGLGYKFTSSDNEHDPIFPEELMQWVERHTVNAREEGATVICGTHWPVVTPSPAYNILGEGNTFVNGEWYCKRFADMGISLMFTGHSHIQCMKEVVSDNGNVIYNVQTSALTGFPPKMRKITIDTDTNVCNIRTIDMDVPSLNLGTSLYEYTRRGFLGSIEDVPYNMEHDISAFAETGGGITLPKDFIYKHPRLISYIGKKINGLTYGKMAKFSEKYHNMKQSEYEHLKNEKVIPFIFSLVEGLFSGNQKYSPDTAEYKIAMAVVNKVDKITKLLHIDLSDFLKGYTLTEFVEPLLYNNGLDNDNIDVFIK